MRTVRSRVLLGVGAWLLGTVSATVGSLYAVGQLGNSLLAESTKQMSVSMVNSDLAHEHSHRAVPLPTPTRKPQLHDHHRARRPGHVAPTPTPDPTSSPTSSPVSSPSPSPAPSSAGVLLTSPGGSAEATCTSNGAYLSYWSPQPGFEVDNVVRGPAAVASVAFESTTSGVTLQVTCQGGVPVKKVLRDE